MARSNDAAPSGPSRGRPPGNGARGRTRAGSRGSGRPARAPEPAAGADGDRGPAAGSPAVGRELRARGRRTLRSLLDAGTEVFAARGYHAARVDDIVKAARTSHGTFYLYFANKEELFRALATDVAREMAELAGRLPALEPGGAGRAALRDWLGAFADLYRRSGAVIRAWTEAEIGDSDFGRLGNEVLAGFTRELDRRIRDAPPTGIDPGVAALCLVTMIERFNYFTLTEQVRVAPAAMVDTLAVAIQASLFGAGALVPPA